jgi:hypothetical protein
MEAVDALDKEDEKLRVASYLRKKAASSTAVRNQR